MVLSVSPFNGRCEAPNCNDCLAINALVTDIGEYIATIPTTNTAEGIANVQATFKTRLDILNDACLPYVNKTIGELVLPTLFENIEDLAQKAAVHNENMMIVEIQSLPSEESTLIERRSVRRNPMQNLLTSLVRTATAEGHHILDKGKVEDTELIVDEIEGVLTDQTKELRTRDRDKTRRVPKKQFVETGIKPGIIEI